MNAANTCKGAAGGLSGMPDISARAASVDWSEVFDGRDGLYDISSRLVHQLHLLMADLEFAFDERRSGSGVQINGCIDFTFSVDSVDASKWLVGHVWSEAKDLLSKIEMCQRALDAAPKAVERRQVRS